MPRPKNWLPADHPLVRMIPVATDTLAANGKALVTGEARRPFRVIGKIAAAA